MGVSFMPMGDAKEWKERLRRREQSSANWDRTFGNKPRGPDALFVRRPNGNGDLGKRFYADFIREVETKRRDPRP